ncbi:DUF6520 family protein [Bizionia sp.]|uniref:DUF6520 family protein n=1 Tax=Bizionia sp. TaxID=1954480 RepID=UPI003A940B08
MKNLKLMLPMMAFIMAIGMSFAFNNSDYLLAEEVVKIGGTTYEVNANCNGETFNCRIQLTDQSGDPIPNEVYQVYGPDATGEYTVLLKSESEEPIPVSASSLTPVE